MYFFGKRFDWTTIAKKIIDHCYYVNDDLSITMIVDKRKGKYDLYDMEELLKRFGFIIIKELKHIYYVTSDKYIHYNILDHIYRDLGSDFIKDMNKKHPNLQAIVATAGDRGGDGGYDCTLSRYIAELEGKTTSEAERNLRYRIEERKQTILEILEVLCILGGGLFVLYLLL